MSRNEFNAERVSCSCRECRRNCLFLPGFLIPADLERMIPPGADPYQWAEINLLASPGTIVMRAGEIFRIPTLVPASKPDGSCIHYQRRACAIWENSPFGCAYFGCGAKDEDRLSRIGANLIYAAHADPESLYSRIWRHLWDLNKRREPVEDIKERMARSDGRRS